MENIKPGQKIVFDLETWITEEMSMQQHTAEVLEIAVDPFKIHETRCIVIVDSEKYGIPLSRVKEVLPANNEQLNLF